mmetsp:Transcript_5817/g.18487  ORF Transcript_5817/g.18487 Transcript_5817/m.18487 type:complete len:251 (-) Transcript_5817:2124-2876(-)
MSGRPLRLYASRASSNLSCKANHSAYGRNSALSNCPSCACDSAMARSHCCSRTYNCISAATSPSFKSTSRARSSRPAPAKIFAHRRRSSLCGPAKSSWRAMPASWSAQPSESWWSPRSLQARAASPAATYIAAAPDQSSTSSAHSACLRTRSRRSTVSDDAAKSLASSHCLKSAKRSIASSTRPARAYTFAASWYLPLYASSSAWKMGSSSGASLPTAVSSAGASPTRDLREPPGAALGAALAPALVPDW